jgi:membrane-associated PAP2 superfamily phosphatase
MAATVAIHFLVVDASPSLILHGWAAALALGIDRATAAQQL